MIFKDLPPIYSVEAEKAVIGAILTDPDRCVDDCLAKLSPDDFFVPANQIIFKAISELRRSGTPIDVSTMTQYFEDRKLFSSIGGYSVFSEMVSGVFSLLTCPAHAETVFQKSRLRKLIQSCGEIVRNAHEEVHDPEGVVDRAERMILLATKDDSSKAIRSSKDVAAEAMLNIEKNMARGGKLVGLTSGIPELDSGTGGFSAGELIIVGARPAVGKTAFALSLAKSIAKSGESVGFFSLEMSEYELMQRMASDESDVLFFRIRNGTLNKDEEASLRQSMDRLGELPIYYSCPSRLNANAFRSQTRRLKAQYDVKAVIVDYLQLMTGDPSAKRDQRWQEVGIITRVMKETAMELGISVIALAQLSRSSEESSEPALHHLRESGNIEQDADKAIFLHRVTDEEDVKIIIPKQRNGPNFRFDMKFDGRHQRFISKPRTAC